MPEIRTLHQVQQGKTKIVSVSSDRIKQFKEKQNTIIHVGTDDYLELKNKPQINKIVLEGNKTFSDFFPGGILIDCGNSFRMVDN